MYLDRKVRQIPVEGGSGRYSSGAVAFKDDWPGLFIRGDECLGLKFTLESHRKKCEQKGVKFPMELEEIIDCIEESVIAKPD